MIKKNSQGKVVEFEDEAAVASMSGRGKDKKGSELATAVPVTGDSVLTEALALAEYEAAIKAADAEAEASMNAVVVELGAEVAKLDAASAIEKKKAKETLKTAVAEADSVRAASVLRAEQTHDLVRDAIIVGFREKMKPINIKLEDAKIAAETALLKAKASAVVKHKARLAAIAQAKSVDAKLAEVAAAQGSATQGSATQGSATQPAEAPAS